MKQFLLMVIMIFLFLMTIRSFGYAPSRLMHDPEVHHGKKSFVQEVGGFNPRGTRRMYQQIAQTRQELHDMLEQLKQQPYLSEIGMQKLLGLIDLELDIVGLLIKQRTGYVIQKAVNTRNKAVKRSVPSIVAVYDVVLDLATMHAELERKLRNYSKRYRYSLWGALNKEDKQMFLNHMRNTLENYYHVIGRMQYASRVIK